MIANPTVGMRVLYFDRLATISFVNGHIIIVELDEPRGGFTRWHAEHDQISELTPEAQELERRRLYADRYL